SVLQRSRQAFSVPPSGSPREGNSIVHRKRYTQSCRSRRSSGCGALPSGGFMLSEPKAANLKTVAAKVGLAPCSVSAILNDTEAARAIPQATKNRVYHAAAELNYRPNLLARSLRTKRTRMVAIVAPGLGWLSVARVVAAAHTRLHKSGYLLVLAASDEKD